MRTAAVPARYFWMFKKAFSTLVLIQCLVFSVACKADVTSALIKVYATAQDLPLIDAVREYINKNSDHGEGEWSQLYGNNHVYVIEQLYRTAIGDSTATRPELLCGHRAQVMQQLLDQLGMNSRTIYLFSNYTGSLMGHVFVEVMNPVTGAWEVQDPDYNIAYENKNGQHVGIAELVATPDFDSFQPVNSTTKGWVEAGAYPLANGQFYNIAYSPGEGMLYYNQQALDSNLVAAVEAYIRANYEGVSYIPVKVGQSIVRPLPNFKNPIQVEQITAGVL